MRGPPPRSEARFPGERRGRRRSLVAFRGTCRRGALGSPAPCSPSSTGLGATRGGSFFFSVGLGGGSPAIAEPGSGDRGADVDRQDTDFHTCGDRRHSCGAFHFRRERRGPMEWRASGEHPTRRSTGPNGGPSRVPPTPPGRSSGRRETLPSTRRILAAVQQAKPFLAKHASRLRNWRTLRRARGRASWRAWRRSASCLARRASCVRRASTSRLTTYAQFAAFRWIVDPWNRFTVPPTRRRIPPRFRSRWRRSPSWYAAPSASTASRTSGNAKSA